MSTTVRVNGTVKFTFFLVIRLNITIAISCDSLIVIFVKLENGPKKHVWNVFKIQIQYEFVKLALIFFLFLLFLSNNTISLKVTSPYYREIQGKLVATCQPSCNFFTFTVKGNLTGRINYNNEFWENLVDRFYLIYPI